MFFRSDRPGWHARRLAFVVALRHAAKEHYMVDPKNGKGGFKEFAKHEKILVNTVPAVTGAVASAPKAGPTAPKPEGDGKVSRKS
jgi:hypothetical protein